MNDYVWYASYGSNINYERFLLYLRGGELQNSGRIYNGSKDRGLPLNSQLLIIPHELYFSGKSRSWNNTAVAYIKSTRDDRESTISRAYLVSKTQFSDIFSQENDIEQKYSDLNIDYKKVASTGFQDLKCPGYNGSYHRVLYLGDIDEIPVMTFTSAVDESNISYGKPDILYLKTIFKGLRQLSSMKDDEIINYLESKKGVYGGYDQKYLTSEII